MRGFGGASAKGMLVIDGIASVEAFELGGNVFPDGALKESMWSGVEG